MLIVHDELKLPMVAVIVTEPLKPVDELSTVTNPVLLTVACVVSLELHAT